MHIYPMARLLSLSQTHRPKHSASSTHTTARASVRPFEKTVHRAQLRQIRSHIRNLKSVFVLLQGGGDRGLVFGHNLLSPQLEAGGEEAVVVGPHRRAQHHRVRSFERSQRLLALRFDRLENPSNNLLN